MTGCLELNMFVVNFIHQVVCAARSKTFVNAADAATTSNVMQKVVDEARPRSARSISRAR
jgi:hypothetical protein